MPWLVTMVAMLAITLSPGTAVLCVASGSHVSLEWLLDFCCTSEPEHTDSHVENGAPQLEGDHGCTDCFDLLLDRDTLKQKEQQLPAISRISDAALGSATADSSYTRRSTIENSALSQLLQQQASVVLLT